MTNSDEYTNLLNSFIKSNNDSMILNEKRFKGYYADEYCEEQLYSLYSSSGASSFSRDSSEEHTYSEYDMDSTEEYSTAPECDIDSIEEYDSYDSKSKYINSFYENKKMYSKKRIYDTSSIQDMSSMFNSWSNRVINKEEEILKKIDKYNNIFFQRIKHNFDKHMAKLVETYLLDKSHENRQIIIKYINSKQTN